MRKHALTAEEKSILILTIAIFFGGWFRFMPAWLAGFPVNDGGLFYTMMNDLRANNFIPPLFTTYNQLNIPFAYPPLALYIGAILSSVFNISGIEILRWLPALINSLTIPVFYLFAKEITEDKFKSAVATLVYAFTPHLMAWLSMGGGLTRSFGTLFMMLTALFSYRMFAQKDGNNLLLTILFGALTALSHTESTVYAIIIPIVFWVFLSRTWRGAKQGFLVAIGVIALAGIWYGYVIYRHGFAPLLSALKTGGQTPLAFLLLFNFREITAEPFIDLIAVIGLLGMILLLSKKQYLIPALYLFIYLFQPRSAHTVVNIPLAIAAGIFITDTLLINFREKVVLLITLLTPLLFANVIYQSYLLSLNHVSDEELSAFQWIKENTPEDSKFLVLTGEPIAFCDSTSEWFPALTDRQSITTIQGREWISGGEIIDLFNNRNDIEMCYGENFGCIEESFSNLNVVPEYLLVSKNHDIYSCGKTKSPATRTESFLFNLLASPLLVPVYESSYVDVFKIN